MNLASPDLLSLQVHLCTQPAKSSKQVESFPVLTALSSSQIPIQAPVREIIQAPCTLVLASCFCRTAGSEETISESNFPMAALLSCSHVLRDSASSWKCR